LITHPVLLVGGRFDGVAPPTNLEAIHQQLIQSEIQFYEEEHSCFDHNTLAFQDINLFIQSKLS